MKVLTTIGTIIIIILAIAIGPSIAIALGTYEFVGFVIIGILDKFKIIEASKDGSELRVIVINSLNPFSLLKSWEFSFSICTIIKNILMSPLILVFILFLLLQN